MIYDRHILGKESLVKITKDIFNLSSNNDCYSGTEAYYKQVRRAYNKTCKMIEAVTPKK